MLKQLVHRPPGRRVAAAATVFLTLTLLGPAVPSATVAAAPILERARPTLHQDLDPEPPVQLTATHPKLESNLAGVARIQREEGAAAALRSATERDLHVADSLVRVVIDSTHSGGSTAEGAVLAAGGRVKATHAGLIEAFVPAASLESLAARSDVRMIRRAAVPEPDSITGEGVAKTNASSWHRYGQSPGQQLPGSHVGLATPGIRGSGVKIAVIDIGFKDLAAAQSSGDLPLGLAKVDLCGGDFDTASNHGTAVAEIVHEMAPGATLGLICVDSEVSLGQSLEVLKSGGYDIVVHSVAWLNTSAGVGLGPVWSPEGIARQAHDAGIMWVNSAGNYAQVHWSGTFIDADNDNYHDFRLGSERDEINNFRIPAGKKVCVHLKWNDWPYSMQDYDLRIINTTTRKLLAESNNRQVVDGYGEPTEAACYQNPSPSQDVEAGFAIKRYSATQKPRFDVWVTKDAPFLEYLVEAGSVTEPASAPYVVAVGAMCVKRDDSHPSPEAAVEFYSSRGPTIDGRVKPDLVSEAGVGTTTVGESGVCQGVVFAGTSAAAPHVAGAGALVKQCFPSLGPDSLRRMLVSQSHTVNVGFPNLPAGDDAPQSNAIGFGRLRLAAPGATCN